MPTLVQAEAVAASAKLNTQFAEDETYIQVNDGPMLSPEFQQLILSPPSSESPPLKFSASLHSMLLIDIESLCSLRDVITVTALKLKISSKDFALNQDKLCIVLKAFPGIQSLSITADSEGTSLPVAPPVFFPKLEYLELRPKSLDPLVSNLNSKLAFNWGAKSPALKEYRIMYSTEESNKGADKYVLLEQLEIFHRNAQIKGVVPFQLGLNLRCWVQDSAFFTKLMEIKAKCKTLRLRLDDSCGCGNYHRGPFQEEFEEFLKSQSDCLEDLYLHVNITVTTGLKFSPMNKLRSLNILPFKFIGNPKSTPVFLPVDAGTFPALEYLKISHYFERHEIFTNGGPIESLKELVLQGVPQEMFLEKWEEVAPNLEKFTIGPLSKEHLKSILTGMKNLKELTVRTLDMTGPEFGSFFTSENPIENQKKSKPIAVFKNLEQLEKLYLFINSDRDVVEAIVKGTVEGNLRPLQLLSLLGDIHQVTEEQENTLRSVHSTVEIRKTDFLPNETSHCNGRCCEARLDSDSD